MPPAPASLLHRLRGPSPRAEAWERLVRLYTPLLQSWAGGLGLGDADASDLVQEVLVGIVRAIPEFEYGPGRTFRALVCTVFRNQWRARLRTRALPPGDTPRPEDSADAPEGLGEAEHRRYLVERALGVLRKEFQPVDWGAFQRHAVGGRPAAEVAAELGVSVKAVYLARARVLRRLREELEGLLG
jgi:RNA polymerase sigma-70 factor, ECF subfamily